MTSFLSLPPNADVIKMAFATILAVNLPMTVYAWYFALAEGPLVGMPIQPFDGSCTMAMITAAALLLMIGFVDRKHEFLRRLGVIFIFAGLATASIPRF